MRIAVLVNYSANNGAASKKWQLIEKKVKAMLPSDTIYFQYNTPCNLENIIRTLIFRFNVKNFVSAGGDGSLNCLLNSLAKINQNHLTEYCIGAIGLGSSNDFHKPVKNQIDGIPVKIDFSVKNYTDSGLICITNYGRPYKRLFIINASLGFTAQGNMLFNKGDRIIRFFKSKSTNLTILWTVFKTLIKFRNLPLQINIGNTSKKVNVTNLSIAKNPNISGNFQYDISTTPNSGKLGFYLAENLSKPAMVALLYNLTRNKFSKIKNCSVNFIENIEIKSDSNIAVETDGEIFFGKKFLFSVFPKSILIAG